MSTGESIRSASETRNALMRVAEVALYFDVSVTTVRRWTEKGVIPFIRIGTGRKKRRSLRYRLADLERVAEGLVVVRGDAAGAAELRGFGALVGGDGRGGE